MIDIANAHTTKSSFDFVLMLLVMMQCKTVFLMMLCYKKILMKYEEKDRVFYLRVLVDLSVRYCYC